MTSRIPEPPSRAEAEGIPDPDELTPGQRATGQEEGVMEPPHDVAIAVDDFGTTPAEMHDGEPLSARLAREEPDVLAGVDRTAGPSEGDTRSDERAGQGIGRLVAPDEGAHSDTEPDLVARDAGTDLGGYSAEESAMHLEPEV